MISFYTSHINSLMLATSLLVHVTAIYNCYSEFLYRLATFVSYYLL